MRLFLFIPLALAGCGLVNPAPGIDGLQLSERQLILRFTDGVVCRTDLQADTSPSGEFADCAHPASYAIGYGRPNILGGLLPDAVEPYAEIAITHGAGRVDRFRTPQSRDWTDAGWSRDDD